MTLSLKNCSVSESQFLKTAMFTTLNRPFSLRTNLNFAVFFSRARSYSSTVVKSLNNNNNLFSRISPIRHQSHVIPVIEQWVEEGRKVKKIELQRIIRDLRSRKRYAHALQVILMGFVYPILFWIFLFISHSFSMRNFQLWNQCGSFCFTFDLLFWIFLGIGTAMFWMFKIRHFSLVISKCRWS